LTLLAARSRDFRRTKRVSRARPSARP